MEITEEQRKRMEANKKRALEIRRKREAEITRLENGVAGSSSIIRTSTLVTPTSVKLTEDQRKLIEMKRQRALEIRSRKLFEEDHKHVQLPPARKRPPADASLAVSATKKQRVDDLIKVKSEDEDQVQPPSARKPPPLASAKKPPILKSEEKKAPETKRPPAKKKKKPRPTKEEAAERRRLRLEEQGRRKVFDFGTYNRRTFAEVAREDPTYHERYMHMLKQKGQTPRRILTQYINWFNNTGGMTSERQIRSRGVRTISERRREEAAEEREYARASGDYFDKEAVGWMLGDSFLYYGRY